MKSVLLRRPPKGDRLRITFAKIVINLDVDHLEYVEDFLVKRAATVEFCIQDEDGTIIGSSQDVVNELGSIPKVDTEAETDEIPLDSSMAGTVGLYHHQMKRRG